METVFEILRLSHGPGFIVQFKHGRGGRYEDIYAHTLNDVTSMILARATELQERESNGGSARLYGRITEGPSPVSTISAGTIDPLAFDEGD